jgi:hypothetical protein
MKTQDISLKHNQIIGLLGHSKKSTIVNVRHCIEKSLVVKESKNPINKRLNSARSMSSMGSVTSLSNIPQRSFSYNSFTSEDSFGRNEDYFGELGSANKHRTE